MSEAKPKRRYMRAPQAHATHHRHAGAQCAAPTDAHPSISPSTTRPTPHHARVSSPRHTKVLSMHGAAATRPNHTSPPLLASALGTEDSVRVGHVQDLAVGRRREATELQCLRRLRVVRVRRALVDLEVAEQLAAVRVVRKHALDRLLDDPVSGAGAARLGARKSTDFQRRLRGTQGDGMPAGHSNGSHMYTFAKASGQDAHLSGMRF